jgi:hypothetical protein
MNLRRVCMWACSHKPHMRAYTHMRAHTAPSIPPNTQRACPSPPVLRVRVAVAAVSGGIRRAGRPATWRTIAGTCPCCTASLYHAAAASRSCRHPRPVWCSTCGAATSHSASRRADRNLRTAQHGLAPPYPARHGDPCQLSPPTRPSRLTQPVLAQQSAALAPQEPARPGCMLHAACCTLHVVRCLLYAACCTLHLVRCRMLHAASCTLPHVARCILYAAACCTLHLVRCMIP